MRAVILLAVGMVAQLAFAVFVARCMRFGLGPGALNSEADSETQGAEELLSAPYRKRAACVVNISSADLAGLLIALHPQPEAAEVRETQAQPVLSQPD